MARESEGQTGGWKRPRILNINLPTDIDIFVKITG